MRRGSPPGPPVPRAREEGPTGARVIVEIVRTGGGYGPFSGCAAGDMAMAVVIKVG